MIRSRPEALTDERTQYYKATNVEIGAGDIASVVRMITCYKVIITGCIAVEAQS